MAVLTTDAWITPEELKNYCNVTGASQDRDFEKIINAVTSLIQDYIGQNVLTRTYTNEVYSGTGDQSLYLRNAPITTITQVDMLIGWDAFTENWTTYHPTLFTASIEDRDRASIYFRLVAFPKGFKNVRVTYVAGYSKDGANSIPIVPADLKSAALELGFDLYKGTDQQLARIASVHTPGGETVSYLNEALPVRVRAILDARARNFC